MGPNAGLFITRLRKQSFSHPNISQPYTLLKTLILLTSELVDNWKISEKNLEDSFHGFNYSSGLQEIKHTLCTQLGVHLWSSRWGVPLPHWCATVSVVVPVTLTHCQANAHREAQSSETSEVNVPGTDPHRHQSRCEGST